MVFATLPVLVDDGTWFSRMPTTASIAMDRFATPHDIDVGMTIGNQFSILINKMQQPLVSRFGINRTRLYGCLVLQSYCKDPFPGLHSWNPKLGADGVVFCFATPCVDFSGFGFE